MKLFGSSIKNIVKTVNKNLSIKTNNRSRNSVSERTLRAKPSKRIMLSDYLRNIREILKVLLRAVHFFFADRVRGLFRSDRVHSVSIAAPGQKGPRQEVARQASRREVLANRDQRPADLHHHPAHLGNPLLSVPPLSSWILYILLYTITYHYVPFYTILYYYILKWPFFLYSLHLPACLFGLFFPFLLDTAYAPCI